MTDAITPYNNLNDNTMKRELLTTLLIMATAISAMADFSFSLDGFKFLAYSHAGPYKPSASVVGIGEERLKETQDSDGILRFPDTVEYEGKTYTVWRIGGNDFWCTHRYNEQFQKTGIKEVIIPDSAYVIENYTFLDMPDLEKLTIGKSLRSFGYYNFNSMKSLTTIRLLERDEDVSLTLAAGAFQSTPMLEHVYCEALKPFEINFTDENFKPKRLVLHVPPGTKALYEEAEGWKEFGEIVEDAAALGQFYKDGYRFQRTTDPGEVALANMSDEKLAEACDSKTWSIPGSVEYNGETYTVTRLSGMMLRGQNTAGIESITMPHSLSYTGSGNFTNMPDLKEVQLSQSLTSFGEGSFVNLPSLRSIDLSAVPFLHFASNTFINVGLESIVIPSGIPVIFPSGDITHFGIMCDMPNLTKIDMGDAQETGRKQFNNLPKLEEVTINATLERIKSSCFQNLEALERIVFIKRDGKGFNINSESFENTPKLKDVYVEDATPFEFRFIADEDAFYPARYTLHVPRGSKELYAAAPGWKEFGKIVEDGGTGSGIEDATADTATWSCTAVTGGVAVTGAEGVEILVATMDGRIMERLTATTGCTTINLPAGLYIVSAAGQSAKVCVK